MIQMSLIPILFLLISCCYLYFKVDNHQWSKWNFYLWNSTYSTFHWDELQIIIYIPIFFNYKFLFVCLNSYLAALSGQRFFKESIFETKWICTHKVATHIWISNSFIHLIISRWMNIFVKLYKTPYNFTKTLKWNMITYNMSYNMYIISNLLIQVYTT